MLSEKIKFILGMTGIFLGSALVGLSGNPKAIIGLISVLLGIYIYSTFNIYRLSEEIKKDNNNR